LIHSVHLLEQEENRKDLEEEIVLGRERFHEEDVKVKMHVLAEGFLIGLNEVKHPSLDECRK
jgi:hypothetical protein